MTTDEDDSVSSTDKSIEKTIQLVKANSHPLKVRLLTLLSIYGRLSTSELVDKSEKSKPTVLKHLDELEKLEQVAYETETSPGAYDRRYYYRTEPNYTIQGQNLRESVRKDPYLALIYSNYQLAIRSQLKEILDQTVEYQKRLSQEVEKLVKKGDGDAIIDLMQDHLGQYQLKFSSEFSETGKGTKEPNDYLKIELFLPIRRVIEQVVKDSWEIDGTLWKNFQ